MTTDYDPAQEMLTLYRRKRELERELALIKSDITALTPVLESHFTAREIKSVKFDDGTVSLRTEHWPGTAPGVRTDDAAATLAAFEETAIFVKPRYNASQLRSWLGELPRDENGDPILPQELINGGIRVIKKVVPSVRST
jgi:hypothetical protein